MTSKPDYPPRPIDQRQESKTFCVLGESVRDMAAISKRFGREVVALANNPELGDSHYTVRLSSIDEGIRDVDVHVTGAFVYLDRVNWINRSQGGE